MRRMRVLAPCFAYEILQSAIMRASSDCNACNNLPSIWGQAKPAKKIDVVLKAFTSRSESTSSSDNSSSSTSKHQARAAISLLEVLVFGRSYASCLRTQPVFLQVPFGDGTAELFSCNHRWIKIKTDQQPQVPHSFNPIMNVPSSAAKISRRHRVD